MEKKISERGGGHIPDVPPPGYATGYYVLCNAPINNIPWHIVFYTLVKACEWGRQTQLKQR